MDVQLQKPSFNGLVKSRICAHSHKASRFRLADFPIIVKAMLQIKKAAAQANAEVLTLSKNKARRIILSSDSLLSKIRPNIFMVDIFSGGGGFAVNVNINEAIIEEDALTNNAQIKPEEVNQSQSSADVCGTALRLALNELGKETILRLDELLGGLDSFISQHGPNKTLARTCWQDALPITMGQRFLGIKDSFFLVRSELNKTLENLCAVPLGGTVIGLGHGATEGYRSRVIECLSELTGRRFAATKHAVSVAQNCPDLATLCATVKLLSQNCIRFGLDLRLLCSGPKGGLFELSLPRVVEGSSFFKNKFNPTVVETMIQSAVMAHSLASADEIYRIIPEVDLNVFEWPLGVHLILALEFLNEGLNTLVKQAITEMSANKARCEELHSYIHQRGLT